MNGFESLKCVRAYTGSYWWPSQFTLSVIEYRVIKVYGSLVV